MRLVPNQPGQVGVQEDPPPQETIFVQLMNEIRWVREEQHKGRDELRKMSEQLGKLDGEFRKLADQVKKWTDTSFTVESSVYKVIYCSCVLITSLIRTFYYTVLAGRHHKKDWDAVREVLA